MSFKVYSGPSQGSRNARNGRKKILNIHGKILNWSEIPFFDVRSTVFAHNRHKKWFKVEVYLNIFQNFPK